jgi:tryptophan 2,3-dioxygenase
MTYLEATGIEQDFIVAMQYSEACGKTHVQAYMDTAEKYSKLQLVEALVVLNNHLDEKKKHTTELFALAIRNKK